MEYMQAAVLTAFGSAEVFEFQTIPKPVPKRRSSGESIRDIAQ